jgi:O-antigen/teichoic acid export membrane protein
MIYLFTFSLLNFGINASLVKYVAELVLSRRFSDMEKYLGTSLILLGGIGALIAVAGSLFASPIVHQFLNGPPDLVRSNILSLRIASIALVLQFMCQVWSAVPAAVQRFDILNGVRVGSELVRVIGTVTLLHLGFALPALLSVTLFASLCACIGYLVATKSLVPQLPLIPNFSGAHARSLLAHSKYILMGNLSNHVVGTADSMLIGYFLPVSSVAYYTIAYGLGQKLWSLVGNVASVVFPAASALSASEESVHLKELYFRGTKLTAAVACFPALSLCLFSRHFLSFWLGPDYATHSANALSILAIAFLLYSLTHVPCLILQATHYASAAAKAFVKYLLLNLCLFVVLIPTFGIVGAAIAFLIAQSLFVPWFVRLASRLLDIRLTHLIRRCYLPVLGLGAAGGCVEWLCEPWIHSFARLVLVVSAGLAVYSSLGVFVLLDSYERATIRLFVLNRVPVLRRRAAR